MLRHRLIFGVIMCVSLVALIWADDRLGRISIEGTFLQPVLAGQPFIPAGLPTFLVFLVLSLLGARELVGMFRAKGAAVSNGLVMFSAAAGFTIMFLSPRTAAGTSVVAWAMTAVALAFLFTMLRHASHGRTEGALAAGGAAMLGMIYLGIVPGFYMLIRETHSAWVLLAVILITKACDIGAYTAGRAFGKHKLIPWLSPAKTWEGLAGGMLFSALVAVVFVAISNQFELAIRWVGETGENLPRAIPLWYAAVTGCLLAVLGHCGDLLESLFKRDAGVKDSGNTIPGFGGVLDVIDSPILIAPVAYWLLRMAP
ncbi:MAG: phosphatidate cytidylyltransferase [Phycisphaeraceae bacterium]